MKLKHLIVGAFALVCGSVGFSGGAEFVDRATPGKYVMKTYRVYPPAGHFSRVYVDIWARNADLGSIYVGGSGQGEVCRVTTNGDGWVSSSGVYNNNPFLWQREITINHYGQVKWGASSGYVELQTRVSW